MKVEDVLARIANYTNDAIIITDADQLDQPGPRIVFANSAFLRLTGYALDEVIGHTPRLFQGSGTSRETRAHIRRALEAREPVNVEILNYTKTGKPYWSDLGIFPMRDDAGRVRYYVAIQRETTERREKEDELHAAKQSAEAATRAKSNFLSHMSHELRTPLNAILGFAEIINKQILGPVGNDKYADYAGDIVLSASYLMDIVNDILDMSRIEAGKVDLHESNVQIDELLEDTRRIVGTYAAHSGIELVMSTQASFRIKADPRLLKQCLVNLLSNAIKFTDRGGTASITVLLLADGQLAFVVNDTGVGIPADRVLEALEPYVSLDRQGNRATRQGTGLGLPITRSFAELHGGSLFINSELGAGTSVFLTLPASRVLSHSAADASGDAWLKLNRNPCEPAVYRDRIETMSDGEIDRLPVGVLLLDAAGTVLKYSATESRFTGLLPEEAIGRNFFTEIAPCTKVSAFRDTFAEGMRDGRLNKVMSYVFRFPKRHMRVVIELRNAKEPERAWVFVRWL